ncbi:unnamed protein product [Ceratitis capitata]|uniref:receptor protein-tyrosine kinase n=1 Tax=Ceratitis capitata TaxID=7213 RepID=A0A811VL09_CERCA|nr:unnamed protein product [Ceratitis capitata]
MRNLRNRSTITASLQQLTWLQEPIWILVFGENIREVTGYILISHVDIQNVVFPRSRSSHCLRACEDEQKAITETTIIRGRTLFNLNVQDQQFALFTAYSKMFTLEMPALRDILQGSVGFFNNFNLCHIKTIDWKEIIWRGCWGEGPNNCQKFSKINCSPQCARRDVVSARDHANVAISSAPAAVRAQTQRECIACKNFYDDGVCKEECPPMQKYNPTNYLWETNPEGKYAYGATCVKECPEHLLKDNGACVRSCPAEKMARDGECVPCNGCTVIEGSIRVLDQTFFGYQHIYSNNSFGPRFIAMHPDRLENLSYFRNLEVIHGRQLMESYFASLSIVRSSLESLELRSLKRINSGAVVIQQNDNIAFAIRSGCWGKGPDQCLECKNFAFNGTCIADCRNITNAYQFDNKTCKECHPECLTCSGPGADHCDECVHVRDEKRCVTVCPDNKYSDYGICRTCHETCEGCTGPKDTIGPGGCKTCNLAIINSDTTVERCLLKNDKCPDGYYWEYVNHKKGQSETVGGQKHLSQMSSTL